MASRRPDGLMRERMLDEIRRRLFSGHWPPGTVLQEQALATELQVSKTPVREALQTLSVQNLLQPVPRVGYVVSSIELEDLSELFELRVVLEGEAVAALASQGKVSVGAKAAEASVAEQEAAFHRYPAGKPRLRRMIESLVEESTRAMHHCGFSDTVLEALVVDHDAIVQAIGARDIVLTRSLMTVHLTRLRESLMAKLRQKLRDQNLLA